MGIIICKEHGRSNIVHLSDTLNELYSNNKKNDTVFMVHFNIDLFDVPVVRYLSVEDDILNYVSPLNIINSEEDFDKLGRDPILCDTCFHNYLSRHNIKVEKK